MCDYSLHLVASRAAKVGDELVTTKFNNSITRGFAAIGSRTWLCAFFLARRSRLRRKSSTSALLVFSRT
jgi:hypothetical protein